MSTTDNIHKKVLSTNALKTNFIPNTTQKLKDHQKRFSNISKEKEPLLSFRQTIHKNTTNYYEQIDMQGSATIIPQKNSSRKNIYMNQNSNIQVPSNQRKQQSNLNNLKAKSPLDKSRLSKINTANPLTVINNNVNKGTIYTSTVINNMGNLSMINQNMGLKIEQNFTKPISQTKNISNKTGDIMTDREKSYREHKEQLSRHQKEQISRHQKEQHSRHQKDQPSRQVREQNINDQKMTKMKSLIMNNKNINEQIDDLICDQEMEFTVAPEKQPRKLSNQFPSRNQSNQFPNRNQSKIICQKEDYTNDSLSEQNNKTEKKQAMIDKPTMILQKAKSEISINTKQRNSVTLLPNSTSQKSISQLTINNQNHQNITLQQTTHKQQKYVPTAVNYEEQLKKFNQLQAELNMSAEIQTIIRLQNRQKDYQVQPNYIEMRQKNFNWFMRAVLMDWMMHVCFQFGLKRETYYIAVALADKYLEKSPDLSKSDFQLVGAASMFIAAKLQEFEALSSADFSKSTDNRYSAVEIRQTELKICKCMNYELNPPTLYMWANRFMVHWDNYIDMTNAKFHPYFQSHKPKYFKKQSQESYLLFREMMQFMDCSNLDVQTLQFAPKILVCSFMYLVLGKNYKEWPAKRIVEEFPRTSHYLVEQEEVSSFNHMFHMFLAESFELDIIELLPAVQYCSTYFTLILNFDAPSYAMKNGEEEEGQLNLEQYESFQTYNGKMIDLIKKRYRGVYP